MSSFVALLSLLLAISSGFSSAENEDSDQNPEFLDMLLATEQYERFAEVMGIPDVNLVRPNEGERNEYPMLNKALEFGDILPAKGQPLREESRQGIDFNRYPGSKWPNGYVPFTISNRFSSSERRTIQDAINIWNSNITCIKLRPRQGEKDYISMFPGDGCWSYMGRTGGAQSLSLQKNGCVHNRIILHELMHAIGFHHEQNRWDRDEYVEVRWENIPEDWHSQYEKTDSGTFGIQCGYDYYSALHYGMPAPGTRKDAFKVLKPNIDTRRMGNGDGFTQTDIDKIHVLYCEGTKTTCTEP